MIKQILLSAAVTSSLFIMSSTHAATAVFAGGCFWCVEKDFEKLNGVSEAISGFTGGAAENPTYSGDHTGHYEAVKITYDPEVVSYEELLEHFWVNHDPFDDRGQFCDKGPSYLSAIFVEDGSQEILAIESKQEVVERFADQKVVTSILPLMTFYPIKGAEEIHQDFYKKRPVRYNLYRYSCGRDSRLKDIWGQDATV